MLTIISLKMKNAHLNPGSFDPPDPWTLRYTKKRNTPTFATELIIAIGRKYRYNNTCFPRGNVKKFIQNLKDEPQHKCSNAHHAAHSWNLVIKLNSRQIYSYTRCLESEPINEIEKGLHTQSHFLKVK